MCGIAGFIGEGDRATIRRMADTLAHRGPDEEGFYRDDQHRCFFGFRRLAIIDLVGGQQPMANEDESVWVMLNGEIYNFQELRTELEKRGHRFRTRSDTEIIAHLYEDEDLDCFRKFNGMFAIAVWDRRKKRLVLARDRLGKKPLYWARFGGTFLFASEPKAMFPHPAVGRRLSRESVLEFFSFLTVPSPATIYERIFKLEPGQLLSYDGSRVETSFYWQPAAPGQQRPSLGAILETADQLLGDATRLRLIADVPLGVFLSGGIDSGTVAYYAARHAPGRIKTFSIGFGVSDFDESRYAKLVSDAIGSEHHARQFEVRDLLELLPEMAGFLDEPFADSSVLPTYLLSKFTRRHVTVALGGDGGDELFLGYPTFQAHRAAELYRRLPPALQKLLERLAQCLPTSYSSLSLDYKIRTFLAGAAEPVARRQQIWVSGFHPGQSSELFTPAFLGGLDTNSPWRALERWLEGRRSSSAVEAAALLYERFYLGDEVLTKVDRASMAASLEVRAPFLDYRLVEFMNALPLALRLRWGKTKYLLKRLMRGRIPDAVIDRPKRGFWVPIGPWFRKELIPLCDEYLNRTRLERGGIFRYTFVEKLLWEHRQGRRDHRRLLWSLLLFEMWRERWLV